jgi:hypothetical protein
MPRSPSCLRLPAALLLSLPAALLPVSPVVVLLVSLVPAVLLALGALASRVRMASEGLPVSHVPAALLVRGPLALLVLLAPEAVVLASMAVRVTRTAAPAAMPLATDAQAMPTATAAQAMARGDTATGQLMASMSPAIPALATAITPTGTADGSAPTRAFGFVPNSECGRQLATTRRRACKRGR